MLTVILLTTGCKYIFLFLTPEQIEPDILYLFVCVYVCVTGMKKKTNIYDSITLKEMSMKV